jgi:hypothetical protein
MNCNLVKDILLPILGLTLVLAQLNQQSLITRKEHVRAVYDAFLSGLLPKLVGLKRGEAASDELRNEINFQLAKLALGASPEILDQIYKHVSSKRPINVDYLNDLRSKMRQDLAPKWWEHMPIFSDVIYRWNESKIGREHMLWMVRAE